MRRKLIHWLQLALSDDWPRWLVAIQEGLAAGLTQRPRLSALVLSGSFVIAVALQASCEAKRTLVLEQQRAVVDAAKRAGKTIIYDKGRDNGIGRVQQ